MVKQSQKEFWNENSQNEKAPNMSFFFRELGTNMFNDFFVSNNTTTHCIKMSANVILLKQMVKSFQQSLNFYKTHL